MKSLESGSAGISFRPMVLDDVSRCLTLLAQLGYELDHDEAKRRFLAVAGFPSHSLLVAELEKKIVGLLHVYARPALEKPPEAVVQAIVVDRSLRGSGIGKAFMTAAERWA